MIDHALVDPIVGRDLAHAVVGSSTAPLVLLDGDLNVVAASGSFCRSFGIDQAAAMGCRFPELGAGEWSAPHLAALLTATADGQAPVEAYEMEVVRPNRPTLRLVLDAQRLAYGNGRTVRLLVSIADVTEVRLSEWLRDDLVQEKAVLLQELQHRVANSLQIIASVLLQNARNVQSEETRLHLHDAHQRVMSVASLQRQLAMTRQGDVALHAYVTELCDSLGASMIRDHDKTALEVDVDDSVICADVSVSLGLIVTELVINSLKHAFPDHRSGKVVVSYRSAGPNWRLSVTDDGVGLPFAPVAVKPGLGTSIVKALAKQLRAEVERVDVHPGTAVWVTHTERAGSPASPAQWAR